LAFPVLKNAPVIPSLIDGSESPSSDEAQGAAADVSTASSQSGPGETVSDASQLAVTVEGPVRFTNFLYVGVTVINSNQFPRIDSSSKVNSSETTTNTSPSCLESTSDISFSSPTASQTHLPPGIVMSRPSFDPKTSSQPQACPLCPRSFKRRYELERHIRVYRHRYECKVTGCKWIFHAPKDLARHALTHTLDRPKYFCPYAQCEYSIPAMGKAFNRKDLRDRHLRNCHRLDDESHGISSL